MSQTWEYAFKSWVREIFKDQWSKLAKPVKSATEVTNKKILKLSADVIKNNEKLIKTSIEASQAIIEEKMVKLQVKVEKGKQRNRIKDYE